MHDASVIPLYLARRDAFADFLSAVDAESQVAWHRADGRFRASDGAPDDLAAVAAVDAAYLRTRSAFNVIDLEGVGPVKEARVLVEQVSGLHKEGGGNPDWYEYKRAREAFLTAATGHLRGLLPGQS
ncbi:hypothetical protein ACFY7Z_21920 [Streptomyces sp. NPDC012623]|uniref:hypothetical protein n=1 Tax=unclassified Streptomyces TaxID=2593676 RepID=UPI0036B594A7